MCTRSFSPLTVLSSFFIMNLSNLILCRTTVTAYQKVCLVIVSVAIRSLRVVVVDLPFLDAVTDLTWTSNQIWQWMLFRDSCNHVDWSIYETCRNDLFCHVIYI